ncbi:MAG: asparagine synthase-related protein, partial [Raoultibacter sp.]
MQQDMIAIIDLGSEHNTLVARDIRALGVYTEIHNFDITADELASLSNVRGIILNGGPNRMVDGAAIDASDAVYQSGIPLFVVDHTGKTAQDFSDWPEGEAERRAVLDAFVFDTCKAEANWNMENFIADQVELLRKQIGDKRVLLALSGGVDSSVVAALLIRAVGTQLSCVHVNHGLLRKGEAEQVCKVFGEEMNANLVYVDAIDRFLGKLEGVSDPEEKRKIIGAEFIRVFEEEARKLEGIDFLGQGTIYPDIVESGT